MKKNILIITAISTSIILASCGGGATNTEAAATEEPAQEEAPATEMAAMSWMVDTEQSNVRWEGGTAGANVYSHFGDIKLAKGELMTEGDMIKGGAFVIDMTTIDPKDEGYSEENPASKLVGHLTSPDFFAVEEFPTAMFEITSMADGAIQGTLQIRGKENAETITISSMEMMEDGTMKATGTLVFDRQKYDVAWEHFLEDTILSDDITLEITLVAKAA